MVTTAVLILVVIQFAQAQTGDIEKQAGFLKPETAPKDKKIAFADFLENYYQKGLKLFPLDATFAGDNRYNDLLHNDITREHREKVNAYYTQYLEALGKYDKNKLTEEEKTSHEVLKWECEINLAGFKYPTYLMPIDQFCSTHLIIGQFACGASAQPFNTKEDYDNWLKRVDVFVAWCDTAIANMREGMEQGIVLPKSLSNKIIPQLASWMIVPAKTHHFYSPL